MDGVFEMLAFGLGRAIPGRNPVVDNLLTHVKGRPASNHVAATRGEVAALNER
jgi:hypothetical protein